MKRCAISREELTLHEAGHLIATAITPEFSPGEFAWHRLPNYEIAHVEPIPSSRFDWENPSDRNTLIVRQVVVALAGGAAVASWRRQSRQTGVCIKAVHETVGNVDFELAHEWLTLQRYDPDQQSIESEITRLFREVCDVFDTPVHRDALGTVSQRIIEQLHAADAAGAIHIKLPGGILLDGIMLNPCDEFTLQATIARRSATVS